MFATVLATVTTFFEVLGGKNDIAFFAQIVVVFLEFLPSTKITKTCGHRCKFRQFDSNMVARKYAFFQTCSVMRILLALQPLIKARIL